MHVQVCFFSGHLSLCAITVTVLFYLYFSLLSILIILYITTQINLLLFEFLCWHIHQCIDGAVCRIQWHLSELKWLMIFKSMFLLLYDPVKIRSVDFSSPQNIYIHFRSSSTDPFVLIIIPSLLVCYDLQLDRPVPEGLVLEQMHGIYTELVYLVHSSLEHLQVANSSIPAKSA